MLTCRHVRFKGALAAIALGVALAAVLGLFGRRHPARSRPVRGLVMRVCDGDTIEVSGHGVVRLLGVDALDFHNEEKIRRQSRNLGMPSQRVKHWSQKAKELARETLLERSVVLEFGPSFRDDYGRKLAYVYLCSKGHPGEPAGISFNERLLEEGLATAYRRYGHPHRERFLLAETKARENGKGFWEEAE